MTTITINDGINTLDRTRYRLIHNYRTKHLPVYDTLSRGPLYYTFIKPTPLPHLQGFNATRSQIPSV